MRMLSKNSWCVVALALLVAAAMVLPACETKKEEKQPKKPAVQTVAKKKPAPATAQAPEPKKPQPATAKAPEPKKPQPTTAKAPDPTTPTAAPKPAGDLVAFTVELPKPLFEGTPKNIKLKVRPVLKGPVKIMLPKGAKNLAAKKTVKGSDEEPIIGELNYVTDGDKEGTDGSYVELGPNKQHVQIDLGAKAKIYAITMWHYHREGRVYRDVIVQVADDADFITGVRTLFNNDGDNSSGMGVGKDMMYIETYKGEAIQLQEPVVARYVRLYSNGNTSNDLNHYTEVEVYGLPAK